MKTQDAIYEIRKQLELYDHAVIYGVSKLIHVDWNFVMECFKDTSFDGFTMTDKVVIQKKLFNQKEIMSDFFQEYYDWSESGVGSIDIILKKYRIIRL